MCPVGRHCTTFHGGVADFSSFALFKSSGVALIAVLLVLEIRSISSPTARTKYHVFLWVKENGFSEWRLEQLADGAIELQGARSAAR